MYIHTHVHRIIYISILKYKVVHIFFIIFPFRNCKQFYRWKYLLIKKPQDTKVVNVCDKDTMCKRIVIESSIALVASNSQTIMQWIID